MLHGSDVLYVARGAGAGPAAAGHRRRRPAARAPDRQRPRGAAHLPAAQVRALYPSATAFVDRHGTGPRSLSSLRALLAESRQRGYAVEHGEVTPGLSSVAAAVLDHNGHPLAGVAVTYAEGDADPVTVAGEVRRTAGLLSTRLGGQPARS